MSDPSATAEGLSRPSSATGCPSRTWRFATIALLPPREVLYAAIDARFERMVAVVHLADVLTHRLTPGGRDGEVDPRVLERFSMQASGLGILSREAEAELVHAETFAEALGQRRDW